MVGEGSGLGGGKEGGEDLGPQQQVRGDAPTPLPGRGRGLSKSGTRSRAASRGSALPAELISRP